MCPLWEDEELKTCEDREREEKQKTEYLIERLQKENNSLKEIIKKINKLTQKNSNKQ